MYIDLTEEIETGKAMLDRHAIIAKIIGPNLPRKTVQEWVMENWGMHVMIKFMPKGFFVAVFPEEEERDHIINLKNWYLNNHPIYMQPWIPNFDPTTQAIYKKPIWIHLYNLPIEYWSEESLEKIGRSLGTLSEIDNGIIEDNLYTYAHMKIAVVKKIPTSITLVTTDGDWKQLLEEEEDISPCTRCGSLLHKPINCRIFVRRAFNRQQKKGEESLG
ncbi:hypothetical protein SUGI_0882530 [Cryptomeria japonica]|nr:hypothetical protein SUGI_0882530 [Cryptomeria japonica]